MGGHALLALIARQIPVADVIAVVDDGLCAVHEVARTLPLRLVLVVDIIVGIVLRS